MLTLTLAQVVVIPAHARVNSQCLPVWNRDRSDLQLVWRGQTYIHGFHVFGAQPSCDACTANGCVQRLFCTDSGAAGWYGRGGRNGDAPLTAAWLLSPSTTYRRVLSAVEGNATMTWTNYYGPGTLVVVGSTLFFYTFNSGTAQGLPRLSSLVFSEWRSGASAASLVSEEIKAYNVLGYSGSYDWWSYASPLYPSGAGAVTLSVENWNSNDGEAANTWAIDAVVSNGARGALVHYLREDCPSVKSASREVATFPDYSCRAFKNGSVQCAAVGTGKYTWAGASQSVSSLGMSFAPLDPFAVPGSLWLHNGVSGYSGIYTVLVGFGHAPALGVAGDALVGVEARADADCASGRRLHLVTRALPGGAETAAEALGCEWRQVAPAADEGEPAYGALAVKWAGPWGDGPLLTAVDLGRGVYHMRGAPETETGDPSTEHVAWGEMGGVVTLRTGGRVLRCPAPGEAGVPTDAAVAAGSVQAGHVPCVRALVPRRVEPGTMYEGCPLLAQGAGNAGVVNALVATGAEPNAKCAGGDTPLLRALMHANAVDALLAAGAAICTWPRNVANVRPPHGDWRGGCARAKKAAPTAPCEPGFWLGEGKICTGLTICAPGSYCPGWHEHTNAAQPCPSGTYGPQYGAASIVGCRPCPTERPFSVPGATDASECVANAPADPIHGTMSETHMATLVPVHADSVSEHVIIAH